MGWFKTFPSRGKIGRLIENFTIVLYFTLMAPRICTFLGNLRIALGCCEAFLFTPEKGVRRLIHLSERISLNVSAKF